jgi:hypothetical protein
VALDQDVRGLQVAVDDALLVGVLHSRADLHEQLQPLADVQLVGVAVLVERDAPDQLHHEEGGAVGGGAGVEQPGDVGVVHQRDRLPLGLEAGENDPGSAALDANELDGDPALDGLGLVGHPDGAHAPLADLL